MFTKIRFRLIFMGLLAAGFLHPSPPYAQSTPVFKVHFVVTTSKAGRRASPAALRREVDILNRYFRAADRSAPVRFRFGSITPYSVARRSPCSAMRMLNRAREHSRAWPGTYARCKDIRVRAPDAVNFLIYDGWSRRKGFRDNTSWGGTAAGLPYVLLDIARLGHKTQSPEEHEMGHAFGLGHVCVPGATRRTSTNIMASHKNCSGSGGQRNLGFTRTQVRTILARAARYKKRMGSFRRGSLLQNTGFEDKMRYWRAGHRLYSTKSQRTGRFAGLAMGGKAALEQTFSPSSSVRVAFAAHIRSRCTTGEMGIRVNGRRVSYRLIRVKTSGFRRYALRPVRIPRGAGASVYFKCDTGFMVIDDVALIRMR